MKKTRKLVLHRETLHAMELRGVAGGTTLEPTNNPKCNLGPSKLCNEGTYGDCTIQNTWGICSDGCTTGGACTTGVSCSCD